MRQHLQGIQDEIQQVTRYGVIRLAEDLFQPKQVVQGGLAQKYARHSHQPNGVGERSPGLACSPWRWRANLEK